MKKFLLSLAAVVPKSRVIKKLGFYTDTVPKKFVLIPRPSAYVGLHCRIIVGQKIQACSIASNEILPRLDLV